MSACRDDFISDNDWQNLVIMNTVMNTHTTLANCNPVSPQPNPIFDT